MTASAPPSPVLVVLAVLLLRLLLVVMRARSILGHGPLLEGDNAQLVDLLLVLHRDEAGVVQLGAEAGDLELGLVVVVVRQFVVQHVAQPPHRVGHVFQGEATDALEDQDGGATRVLLGWGSQGCPVAVAVATTAPTGTAPAARGPVVPVGAVLGR